MSAVCDHCVQNVPLDLFLPLRALGRYSRGLGWFLGVEVFKGEMPLLNSMRRDAKGALFARLCGLH
jgi:hypothetical protein